MLKSKTNTNTRPLLLARQQLYQRIRDFFAAREVLEVQTPLLSPTTASDCHLHSLRVESPGQPLHYLQTSPELAMKKLLARGSGAIFQIGPAFRAEECGTHHSTEFTLLEWYRPGLSFTGLIEETCALVQSVLEIQSLQQRRYRDLFVAAFAVNPHQADITTLRALVATHTTLHTPENLYREDCLDILMSHAIDAFFENNTAHSLLVVTDYPACQAAMSRCRIDNGDAICKRFELFIDGMEIANGYDELTCPETQRKRFNDDLAMRKARGLPAVAVDNELVALMQHPGLPEMTGIALGIDRLLMLVLGITSIAALHA